MKMKRRGISKSGWYICIDDEMIPYEERMLPPVTPLIRCCICDLPSNCLYETGVIFASRAVCVHCIRKGLELLIKEGVKG